MIYEPTCPICGKSVADYKGPCPNAAEEDEMSEEWLSRIIIGVMAFILVSVWAIALLMAAAAVTGHMTWRL